MLLLIVVGGATVAVADLDEQRRCCLCLKGVPRNVSVVPLHVYAASDLEQHFTMDEPIYVCVFDIVKVVAELSSLKFLCGACICHVQVHYLNMASMSPMLMCLSQEYFKIASMTMLYPT